MARYDKETNPNKEELEKLDKEIIDLRTKQQELSNAPDFEECKSEYKYNQEVMFKGRLIACYTYGKTGELRYEVEFGKSDRYNHSVHIDDEEIMSKDLVESELGQLIYVQKKGDE